jgi:DUF917 family protein
MAEKSLSIEDLWDLVAGGAALSTGGGGVGPTREQFERVVKPVYEGGFRPRLIDVADLADDDAVYLGAGAGGGVRLEEKQKWLLNPGWGARWHPEYDPTRWVQARLRELEFLYPIPSWSKIPDRDWGPDVAETRLKELIGKPPAAYVPFEVGPNVFQQLLNATRKDKPVVDADVAGYRAVPEFSLCSLAVYGAPIAPVVFATAWGDLIVYERVLNWQRLEDITRQLAVACGGGVPGWMAVEGRLLKRAAVAGALSKAMAVGRAIRMARERGEDPVAGAARAAGGYVLFRGRVIAQLNEDKGAFIWGEIRLEGTGAFEGRWFKIWYKNENHMSWLDGRPFVMSPDLITVLDAESGFGLSNFAPWEWRWGREVAVLGVPCAPVWRTELGLRIFHPWRWGFACDYVPIEERLKEFGYEKVV